MMEDSTWNISLDQASNEDIRQQWFRPLFDGLHDLKIERLKEAIAERLVKDFGISFAPYRDYASIPFDNLLPYAHKNLDSQYPTEEDKRRFIETYANKHGFTVDLSRDSFSDAVHRMLDASVNAVVVEQLFDLMKSQSQATSALSSWRLDAGLINQLTSHYDRKRDVLAKSYADTVGEIVRDLSIGETKPIYFLSIGGCDGTLDQAMCQKFQKQFPNHRIHVVNIDPYATKENFIFDAQDGTLINDISIDDVGALSTRLDNIIPAGAVRILGCARALHHTKLSAGAFIGCVSHYTVMPLCYLNTQ